MTYKKSSTDFAVKNDFRQCLKSQFVFPLLVLIYLIGKLCIGIFDAHFYTVESFEYMLFKSSSVFFTTTVELALIMCVAGVLAAVKSFAFLRKVPSTNVYLSLPITRSDLLKNRIKCATLYFGIATFVPMVFAMALNFVLFNPNAYFVGICFLYASGFFITAMVGFAIATAVSLAVGRVGEAVFFSAVIIDAPLLIATVLPRIVNMYVNGASLANGNYHNSLLQRFVFDFAENCYWLEPINFFKNANQYGLLRYGEEYIKLEFDIVGPMIFMAVASIIILAISFKVFKNRKAENAGVVGANKPLVVGTGIVAGFVLFGAINLTNYIDRIVAGIIALVIAIVAYLAVTMILYRSKKNIIKNFKVVPCFAGGLVVVLVFCFTGFFGTYNKVPDVSKIDYAYAVASAGDGYITSNNNYSSITSAYDHDTVVGRIADAEDLKNLVEIHKSVVDSLGDGDGTFKVVYVMKDGSTIVRGYYDVGEEAEQNTLKIYNTKSYKEQVKFGFTTSNATIIKQMDLVSAQWQNNRETYTRIDGAEHDIQTTQLYKYHAMSDENMVFLSDKSQINSVNLSDTITTAQLRELKACMAQDIENLDIQKLLLSGENAVYFLGINDDYHFEYDENFDISRLDLMADYEYVDRYPIYKSMTRTIAYINSLNLTIPEIDVNSIKSVKYIDANERYGKPEPFNYYNPIAKDQSFYAFALSNDATDYYEYMYGESYFRYNGDEFENGTESTDRALIEALYNSSVNNYKLIGDNGKIVLFTLDNGSIFTGYVPEELVPFEIK